MYQGEEKQLNQLMASCLNLNLRGMFRNASRMASNTSLLVYRVKLFLENEKSAEILAKVFRNTVQRLT